MEKIICAAIWFNDGKEHPHQPVNITEGFVVCGRRHHNCYQTAAILSGGISLKLLVGRDGQGFVTTEDRFVDRKEGYRIAKAANQLLHDYHDKSDPILISEDLYLKESEK